MKITFPLSHKELTLTFDQHIRSGRGGACDFRANYEPGCAPVSGIVFLFHEDGGGDWMRITDSDGRRWEMAHLSQRFFKTGDRVKSGQKAFVTGGRPGEYHSGKTTSGPHLHLQIFDRNGNRIDPWPLLINASLFMENSDLAKKLEGKTYIVTDGADKGKIYAVKNGQARWANPDIETAHIHGLLVDKPDAWLSAADHARIPKGAQLQFKDGWLLSLFREIKSRGDWEKINKAL